MTVTATTTPPGSDAGGTPPPPEPKPDPPAPPPPPLPPPPAPEPTDPEDAADGVTADGDQVRVPTSKFKTIKDKAKAKGRREAEAELLAPVLAAGFKTLDELIAAAKPRESTMTTIVPPGATADPTAGAAGGQPIVPAPAPVVPAPVVPAPAPGPAPAGDGRALSPDARERIRRETEARKAAETTAANAVKAAEDAKKAAETQIAESKALHKLGYKMAALGVEDTDYALHLYQTHRAGLDDEGKKKLDAASVPASADGKTPAQPSGFDTWVADLKKAKPALFKTQTAPVQTGPVGAAPAPAGPANVAATAGDGAKIDVRNMTPDQYKAYCKERGINPKA